MAGGGLMDNNIDIKYSYEIRNSNGKLIKKSRLRKCRSWLITSLLYLYNNFSSTSTTSSAWKVMAGINDNTYGVQVGTGTNVVAFTNTALQTIIVHGTGAGQLQYGAVSTGAPSATATYTSFRITRVFTNGSSGSITVNEIGLMYVATTNQLGIRDLTGGIAIGVGQQLTLNYIITTTI